MSELTKIKDISMKYDISARTLRYYEDMGLITSTRSDEYAYRLYDETAMRKLEQILILRKLNISIRDIQLIFNTTGSDVVLNVLGKKVNDIDNEVALLHELKIIVIDFIRQIEQVDFSKESDIKLLYEKAKEIETQIVNVDYNGSPSKINQLIKAAEKLEREPDILIVEMPPCRVVTSGPISGQEDNDRFDDMWMRLGKRVADKIHSRDFMYYDAKIQKTVWMYMLEDWMTADDTEGYEIITFDGGLYASALANSWEYGEYDRVIRGISSWLKSQEHLEADDNSGRHILYNFAGPHSEQMKEWNYGKVQYFVPIRVSASTKE